MGKKDSNIELDLTGTGPVVKRQSESSDDPTDGDTPDSNSSSGINDDHENPDGSKTVYATAPESDGGEVTRRIPSELTESQAGVVRAILDNPDLSYGDLANETKYSKSLIGKVSRSVALSLCDPLTTPQEAFEELRDDQQRILLAYADAGQDITYAGLADELGISKSKIESTVRYNRPILTHIEAGRVTRPDALDGDDSDANEPLESKTESWTAGSPRDGGSPSVTLSLSHPEAFDLLTSDAPAWLLRRVYTEIVGEDAALPAEDDA